MSCVLMISKTYLTRQNPGTLCRVVRGMRWLALKGCYAAAIHFAAVLDSLGDIRDSQRIQDGNESGTRRLSPDDVEGVKVYRHADSADPMVTPGAGRLLQPIKYSSIALAAPRPSLMAHTTSD